MACGLTAVPRTMKSLLFFLTLLVASVYTRVSIDRVIFDDCSDDSWMLSKMRATSQPEGYVITVDMARGPNYTQVLHEVRILFPRCRGLWHCDPKPVTMEMDFSCASQNLTKLQEESCRLAEGIVESEEAVHEFQYRLNVTMSFCVKYMDTSFNLDWSGSASDEEDANQSEGDEPAST